MFFDSNPLLTLSVVLVAGVSFGAIARKLRLPEISGQILVGVALGPSVLKVFGPGTIEGFQPITHFALGLIAVEVGSHLNLRKLRNAYRRLLTLLALESILVPALVFLGVLFLPDVSWLFAVLLATLAVSTFPAAVLAVVKETRSRGMFVRTLVAAVALNNIACILLFEVAYAFARANLDPGSGYTPLTAVLSPFRQLVASAVLGGGAGIILVAATRHVVLSDRLATASLITILFTAGVADYLGISSLLSCLFLGVAIANLTPEKEEVGHAVFSDFENAIFAIFFTLAGIAVDLRYMVAGGLIAVAAILGRMLGKILSARIAMKLAGATEKVRKNLGLALIPQGGVAVGLILLVHENTVFAPIRDLFLAVGLTAVAFNDIVGPIFVRHALSRSGDLGKDHPRLIDFIHEENIVTDFQADSKADAIRQLTDLLIRSNNLDTDRDRLLKSVLDREREVSTCIGGGLAIPHGILEEGSAIVGVMGLSSKGLPFETPDGIPIHCMVLLGTPPDQRERHLEVLAALARAIGSDRYIQKQLYNAKSPAHASEILHHEEFEDFNYFLQEE